MNDVSADLYFRAPTAKWALVFHVNNCWIETFLSNDKAALEAFWPERRQFLAQASRDQVKEAQNESWRSGKAEAKLLPASAVKDCAVVASCPPSALTQ